MKLFKSSNIRPLLTPESFLISDSHYGVTADIYRCLDCGFLQCSSVGDIVHFYEKLKDYSYEMSRMARSLQAKRILSTIGKYKPNGRLLDVGAGSGILVEEAINLGYGAEGIEPSKWLVQKAKEYNLSVYLGTLPNIKIKGLYDVVTLIDVIEHVYDPLGFLFRVKDLVNKEGIIVAVVPDVGSFLARLMGKKWWHFRVAHLGYFNKYNFIKIFDKIGFKPVKLRRPSWYFTLDYLFKRINVYLPDFIHLSIGDYLKKIIIPLNLRDSMLGIFKKK